MAQCLGIQNCANMQGGAEEWTTVSQSEEEHFDIITLANVLFLSVFF